MQNENAIFARAEIELHVPSINLFPVDFLFLQLNNDSDTFSKLSNLKIEYAELENNLWFV